MNNLQDLRLETEILPLFDRSLNTFTKKQILEILEKPLPGKKEIRNRQLILDGLEKNEKVLSDYSYMVLALDEVHHFLSQEKIEDLSQKKLRFQVLASKREKTWYKSRFNQMVLLFHRLESRYFARLELSVFPNVYKDEIKGILHFFSLLQLDRYEPLVRENRLRDKEVIELTNRINDLKDQGEIRLFWDRLFLFEAYLSIQQSSALRKFVFPEVGTKILCLQEFYHPLLDNPVKNTLQTDKPVLVLNGPNMSGKSTFLKSVGLCVYLAHLGLPIPASKGSIPFFESFCVEINRRDDLLNGYSHFMTEVMTLKNVVKKAIDGEACFAVFDELFSGTNVEDGFEICKTTIKGLAQFKDSFFMISTHIQELKSVGNNQIDTYFIDCELQGTQPTFTYQLKPGWSDIKVGRILFDKEGLNALLSHPEG